MSIASEISRKAKGTYSNNSIYFDKYTRRVVAKITEYSWNATTNKYSALMFGDGSILVLNFDTDAQEPNPPKWAYAEEIGGVYDSLEELKKSVEKWNYEEFPKPVFKEITGGI